MLLLQNLVEIFILLLPLLFPGAEVENMKFVGTVAEQFKLKGSETLPVLVDRFTVQRAPDLSALTPRDQVLQVNRIRSKEAHLAQTALHTA